VRLFWGDAVWRVLGMLLSWCPVLSCWLTREGLLPLSSWLSHDQN
jgi:hypothetical protein